MPNSKTPDHVNHPSHYGGDSTYEAVNVIEAWNLGWHLGSAVKYIARAGKKPDNSELQDLKKARWCIDRRIAQLEKPNNDVPVAEPEKHLLTWEQADAALKVGKKVSHLEWAANEFLSSKDGYYFDEVGNVHHPADFALGSPLFYIL